MTMNSSLDLYRHLLRMIRLKLPPNARSYYRSYLKNQFRGHLDETDVDRITKMHLMALEKGDWVVKKYQK